MTERVDIEAISARLKAATPGPWYKPEGQPWLNQRIVFGPSDSMPDRLEQVCSLDEGAHRPEVDATLIAHAPTDLAACVEEIRELRELVNEIDGICTDTFTDPNDLIEQAITRHRAWEAERG